MACIQRGSEGGNEIAANLANGFADGRALTAAVPLTHRNSVSKEKGAQIEGEGPS
jgi:hypothetical protein